MTDIKSNQQQQQNEHISHQKPQQKEWPMNSRLHQLRNERVRSISTSYDEPDVVVDMDMNNYSNNCNNTDHKRPSPNIHRRFQKGCTPMSQMLASRIPNSLSLHEDEIKSTTSNKIGPEEFVEMMRRRKTPLYLNHLLYQQQQQQQLMKGRRRTVSENQASLMLKFPQTLRQKYADQSQIPNVVVLDRQKSAASDHASPPSDGLLVGLAAAGALGGPAGEMAGAVGSGGGGILAADGSGGGISGVASGVNNRKLLHQSVSGGRLLAAKHSSIGHDPMSNFPKMQVGSPISPLNEFSLYGRSPSEHMVIWKEANKRDKIIKISANDDDSIEEEITTCCLETLIENIIRRHTVYDAMPNHARVIILDLNLKVGSAFDALAYDGIHAAPLWDNDSKEFVGMITVTDFISILQQFLHQPEVLASIRDDKVCKWRDHLLSQHQQKHQLHQRLHQQLNLQQQQLQQQQQQLQQQLQQQQQHQQNLNNQRHHQHHQHHHLHQQSNSITTTLQPSSLSPPSTTFSNNNINNYNNHNSNFYADNNSDNNTNSGNNNNDINNFINTTDNSNYNIADDNSISSSSSSNCMLTIKADSNLDDLITHLDYYHIHRVVAVDASTKNALYIATYRRILHYIWSKLPPLNHRGVTTNVFNRTLQQVNLGSYMDLVSVSLSTPVHEIFSILMSRRLSAVPVVDDCYRVVDVFRKADVMSLIIDGSFHDLYCPVEDVLLYERNGFEGLYKCKKTDVVYNIIHSFVHLELHRLVVVDDEDRLEGIITTSDIIKFFLDGDHTSMSDED